MKAVIILLLIINTFVKASFICEGISENIPKDRFSTKTGYFVSWKDTSYLSAFEKEGTILKISIRL